MGLVSRWALLAKVSVTDHKKLLSHYGGAKTKRLTNLEIPPDPTKGSLIHKGNQVAFHGWIWQGSDNNGNVDVIFVLLVTSTPLSCPESLKL